ncbi:MAG: ATP-binding protein [Anaerolineaceae bacterium]|jgi:uncharacterized protein (TIGR00269 family)|nr:ATP-binding protein [Anaerolineaceae bacterium]
MNCKKCGQRAAIKMPQHNMALCREHFLEWIPLHTQRTIEKYRMFTREEKILVAVSGGKDSLALWDVLQRLGYQADGIYIHLGITDPQNELAYSDTSCTFSRQFAEQHGLNLHVVNVKETYGETISEINSRSAHGRAKPCSICGLVKRHIMNQFAHDEGYPVLATGHNLDDEAAALFGNTLTWTVDMLKRQSPRLPAMPGFARKAKPFCRIYERESAAYALMRNIAYIYEECPFSGGARTIQYKQMLNQLEKRSPGTKMNFYIQFLKAQSELFNETQAAIPIEEYCPICGQPTHSGQLCAFCRLMGAE